MSLIVGNDNYTLAFGGLYLLEFIVMISFNKIFWSSFGSKHIWTTLASGIDVGQGINVGPGKFGKKNKRRALNTHVLCSK